jgi:hypothetical protein
VIRLQPSYTVSKDVLSVISPEKLSVSVRRKSVSDRRGSSPGKDGQVSIQYERGGSGSGKDNRVSKDKSPSGSDRYGSVYSNRHGSSVTDGRPSERRGSLQTEISGYETSSSCTTPPFQRNGPSNDHLMKDVTPTAFKARPSKLKRTSIMSIMSVTESVRPVDVKLSGYDSLLVLLFFVHCMDESSSPPEKTLQRIQKKTSGRNRVVP